MPQIREVPTRPRLTPHQAEVLARIERQSRGSRGAARSVDIGCEGAVNRLVVKGYLSAEPVVGPRGGVTFLLRPVSDAAAAVVAAERRSVTA